MKIEVAIKGVLQERSALQKEEGVSNPSYISEHMQRLVQFNSVLEERLGEEEKKLEVEEARLFKGYRAKSMSVNASQTQIKYDIAVDRAEVTRLTRLCNSSYKLVSASQSRVKHLVEEAHNQI